MSDSATATQSWTVLAHLLRPQGRKGEILAELLTDFPDRFSQRDQLFLAPAHFIGDPSDPRLRLAEVVSHWLPVGRNHGRIVLHLAGADSIEEAEELAGLELIIPTAARVPLDEESDEQYIDDLLDCQVFDLAGSDPETSVGTVTAVDFPTTPDGSRRLAEAAPLLTVLTPDGQEILIPYVQTFLVTLAPAAKRIEMRLPQGLLDLNR